VNISRMRSASRTAWPGLKAIAAGRSYRHYAVEIASLKGGCHVLDCLNHSMFH
jgi:hypothetical protein